MAESRGKQSFRDFTRNINESKRFIIKAINAGESYTVQNLYDWFGDMLTYYAQFLEDEHLDYELWFNRAVRKTDDIITFLLDNYSFDEGNDDDEGQGDNDNGEEEDRDEDTETDNEIFGYPVITREECEQTDSSSKVRGQIFYTLEQLEDYIKDIPPEVIRGIVLRDGANEEDIGFSICAGDTR